MELDDIAAKEWDSSACGWRDDTGDLLALMCAAIYVDVNRLDPRSNVTTVEDAIQYARRRGYE